MNEKRMIAKSVLRSVRRMQPNNPKLPADGGDYRKSYTKFLLLLYTMDGLKTSYLAQLLRRGERSTAHYLQAFRGFGWVAPVRRGMQGSYWHILPKGLQQLERLFDGGSGSVERVFQKRGTYVDTDKPKYLGRHDAYLTDMLMRLIQSFPRELGGVEKVYGPIVTRLMYLTKVHGYMAGREVTWKEPVYCPDGWVRVRVGGKWLNLNLEMDISRMNYSMLLEKVRKFRAYTHLNRRDCRIEEHVIAFVVKDDTKGGSVRPAKIVDLFNPEVPTNTDSFSVKVQNLRKEFFEAVATAPIVIATTVDYMEKENPIADMIWTSSHEHGYLFALKDLVEWFGLEEASDMPFVGEEAWIKALEDESLEWIWWK